MWERVLSYVCACALLLALFFVLSFNSGFGYVYMQWLGWQVQSNILLLLLLSFFAVALMALLWLFLRKLLQRQVAKHFVPKSFRQLHPYERLGIIWLLHAERVEQDKVLTTYQNSALLYPLVQARVEIRQGNTAQAKEWLKQIKNPLFELAELAKIDVALAEKNYAEALQRLEFLTVQPLSSWLSPVAAAYQAELQEKWLLLSQTCPWWIFKASHQPQFNCAQQQLWLQALLLQSDVATLEDQQLLLAWYRQGLNECLQGNVDEKITLLKLMSQYVALDLDSVDLSKRILSHLFVPEVLYIWLDKSLGQSLDIAVIAEQVAHWQEQYPAQPSLTFAQWHILQRQNKPEAAAELLPLFPDDAYMAYLRVQNTLQSSGQMQHDLKLLLQYSKQDFRFDL